MDLKEIIKWFIPCFHRLLRVFARKFDVCLTFACLFLFFFTCPSLAARVNRAGLSLGSSDNYLVSDNDYTKNVGLIKNESLSLSGGQSEVVLRNVENDSPLREDTSVGRTFGVRFKKMMQALIPLAFHMGSAATWAVIAALVGIKTLAVTLFIVKILLVAGAAKVILAVYDKLGALFASKGHHSYPSHGWSPHQKEIHLHIHNNGYQGLGTDHESISPWNREGVQTQAESKHVNVVYDPYAAGPQTISTPYGNYVKMQPGQQATHTA